MIIELKYFKLDYRDEVSDPVEKKDFDRMWLSEQHEVAKKYRTVFMKRCPGGNPAIVDILPHCKITTLLAEHREVICYADQNGELADWSEINAEPSLWSYQIRRISFEELQQLRKLRDDVYVRNSDEDLFYWLVDMEINIAR